MSELSNEDKQKKEILLKKVEEQKQKQRAYRRRREEIYNKLYPTAKLDRIISELQSSISSNERIVELYEEKQGEKSEEDRVEVRILENKREMATSSVAKVQELRNQLAVEKEKQKEEQVKLQRLEQKYSLPAEKPKGLFAYAISGIKRFIKRKDIAMAKQQTEIDIKETRDRVDEATCRVNVLEEKLKYEEEMAQFYQSNYKELKAKEEGKRIEEEKKIEDEIQQKRKEIDEQKQKKEMLEKERQKVLKGQEEMSKEEREQLKKEQRESNKGAQAAGEEIKRLQAQIKEIDPNHYADEIFSEMFNDPFYTFFQQGNQTRSQPTTNKEESDKARSEELDDKYSEYRRDLKVDNSNNSIEQNAIKTMSEKSLIEENENMKSDRIK